MSKTTILIVDDHPLLRGALRREMGNEKDMEVVAEAGDGEEAVKLAQELKPDIVVMDIVMPKLSGIEASKKLKEIAPNTTFMSGFGQTEAMLVTGGLMEERPGSAGKPTPISRVALFDDYDNEVPVGTPGEICVRGPAVFLGYWGRDEDNAYTFRNGWHHTGDIGRFDEDGYLWYVKRKAEKELIKPGGENVYPAEVEKTILEHEKVAEVSVIGVADQKWGEAIKAVCVLKPGESLDPQELAEFVASKIARYKKPQYVDFVDALPKTEDGEVDRDQVKKDHGGKY